MNEAVVEKPEMLYHYCSLSTFLKIIESKQIWLSDIRKSNDSKELRWIIERVHLFARQLLQNSKESQLVQSIQKASDYDHAETLLDIISMLQKGYNPATRSVNLNGEQYRQIIDILLQSVNIEIDKAQNSYLDELDKDENIHAWAICLSEQGDMMRQWLGYGDDGAGISIGFRYDSLVCLKSTNHILNNICQFGLSKVQYLAQDDEIAEILNLGITKEDIRRKALSIGASSLRKAKELPPIYKHPSFSDEVEWRIFLMPKIPDSFVASFRHLQKPDNMVSDNIEIGNFGFYTRNKQIISYLPLAINNMKSMLKKIYIGPKAKVTKRDIKTILFRYELIDSLDDDSIEVEISSSTYQ